MTWIITKYLLTAGMVVFISEVAKRSDRLGGFIAALPLMTLLTLVWLYVENQPERNTSATAAIVASSKLGRVNGINGNGAVSDIEDLCLSISRAW
jgi:hypothetical protein